MVINPSKLFMVMICCGTMLTAQATDSRYYYQSQNISTVNDHNHTVSSLVIGKDKIAEIVPGTANKTHYLLGDGKSEDLILNRNAQRSESNSIQSTDFDAYGTSGQLSSNQQISQPNYNGEYQDPSTNLVYLHARDYQPDSQRFMTMDSYTVWNKYNFASADPVNYIDPTGHDSESDDIDMDAAQYFTLGVSAINSMGIFVSFGLGQFGLSWINGMMALSSGSSIIVNIWPLAGSARDDYQQPADSEFWICSSISLGMTLIPLEYYIMKRRQQRQMIQQAQNQQDEAVNAKWRELKQNTQKITLEALQKKGAEQDLIDLMGFEEGDIGLAHVANKGADNEVWHAAKEGNMAEWLRQKPQCPLCKEEGTFRDSDWVRFGVVAEAALEGAVV